MKTNKECKHMVGAGCKKCASELDAIAKNIKCDNSKKLSRLKAAKRQEGEQ